MLNNVLQKQGKFPLLISLLLAPSGCSVNSRGYSVTSEKERCHMLLALNTEQLATMNGDSSNSGNLSLSCSVSSIKIEELEVFRGGKLSRKLLQINEKH